MNLLWLLLTALSGSAQPRDVVITITSVESDTVDDVSSWCVQTEGALSDDTLVVCDDPMSGHFVQVHNMGHSSNFHLAEVQVFGF